MKRMAYSGTPEEAKAKAVAYSREYRRKMREADPQKLKALWRKYKGLPISTHPEPTLCESCGERRPLRLDHDHKTGRFRGWLCHKCNVAIGLLGDTLAGVEKAARYLLERNHAVGP